MSDENLKNLIDKFESIDNSVNTILSSLKNILTNKNVKTSEVDKLSDLVSKVDKLKPQEFGVRINYTATNQDEFVTYVGDAVSMTPATSSSYGSWDTINFIRDIRPCGFINGAVTKYINKNDFSLYEDGTSVPNDVDVMIEFPKFYWKIMQQDMYVDIFVSDTKLDEGYECPAHKIGNDEKDYVYIGAYLGFTETINNKNILRSRGNATPTEDAIIDFYNYAKNVGVGYSIIDYYCILMLQVLYITMFKSITPNEFSCGIRGSVQKTGITYKNGMMFGGLDMHNKFLGVEDFCGNLDQWVFGVSCSNLVLRLLDRKGREFLYFNVGSDYLHLIQGGTYTGFLPKACLSSRETSNFQARCLLKSSTTENIAYGNGQQATGSIFECRTFGNYTYRKGSRLIFYGEDSQSAAQRVKEDSLLLSENEKVGGIL
ncbi:UNVERIFIED_CONTAM: hypothetical protein C3P01_16850 [Clostridioides difficile]|uniref:hypothetical protein n=1 Tax=Clostridioides difficile TaxID=1496 RepID=UPI000D6547A8|nr:hypothetical protein [Clostridioides difficile]HBY2626687.1 hypothetical protein [Clostridioides difficile]HBY3616125.1 hypothetical protein [Clostridioides difficile]